MKKLKKSARYPVSKTWRGKPRGLAEAPRWWAYGVIWRGPAGRLAKSGGGMNERQKTALKSRKRKKRKRKK